MLTCTLRLHYPALSAQWDAMTLSLTLVGSCSQSSAAGRRKGGPRRVKGLSQTAPQDAALFMFTFEVLAALHLCCSTYWSLHTEAPCDRTPPTRISASLQVGPTFTMDGPAPAPARSINGGPELPSNDFSGPAVLADSTFFDRLSRLDWFASASGC